MALLRKYWPFPTYKRAEYIDGKLIVHTHVPLASRSDDTILRCHGWDRTSPTCFERCLPVDAIPWYLTVDQDRLFEVMRKIDAEELQYREKAKAAMTPRFATEVPAGAAWVDDVIEANCRLEVLSALRKGANLDDAFAAAQQAVRGYIRDHNARHADVFAHRDLEAGTQILVLLKNRILRALTAGDTHVAE